MTYEETKYGIGWAVCMIKAGGAVRRACWPKQTHVFLLTGYDKKGRETGVKTAIMARRNTTDDKDNTTECADMVVKDWAATSDDLLATDWEAYESESEGAVFRQAADGTARSRAAQDQGRGCYVSAMLWSHGFYLGFECHGEDKCPAAQCVVNPERCMWRAGFECQERGTRKAAVEKLRDWLQAEVEKLEKEGVR